MWTHSTPKLTGKTVVVLTRPFVHSKMKLIKSIFVTKKYITKLAFITLSYSCADRTIAFSN